MEVSKRIIALGLSIMVVLPFICAFAVLASPSNSAADPTPVVEKVAPVAQTATDVVEESQPEEQQGPITTQLLQEVSYHYGLTEGAYWTEYQGEYRLRTAADDLWGSARPAGSGGYQSCNYQNQYECHGFACYVLAKAVSRLRGEDTEVVPRTGDGEGFVKLMPNQVTDLRIGDVVRVEGFSYQHTALVYDITKDGRLIFLESGGGNRCRIRLGVGFNHDPDYDTLEKITDRYALEYVYRYVGEETETIQS